MNAVSKLYASEREKIDGNVAAIAQALARQSGVMEKKHAGLYSLEQLDYIADKLEEFFGLNF